MNRMEYQKMINLLDKTTTQYQKITNLLDNTTIQPSNHPPKMGRNKKRFA